MVEYWILVVQILLLIVGGALAIWLSGTKSWVNKRMENSANHADIDKLVSLMEAVTQATKTIEAKISTEVWNRQARWTIKRDALFEVAKELAALMHALACLDNLSLHIKTAVDPAIRDKRMNEYNDAIEFWMQTLLTFKRARALAVLVCETELRTKLDSVGNLITKASDNVAWDTRERDLYKEITTALEDVLKEMRKELGIS
jgi:hypothetical protein